jgi:hypothetical protein
LGNRVGAALGRLAGGWAGSLYAALVPTGDSVPETAKTFLEDVWWQAPWWVALGNTLAVIVVCLSPPLLIRRFAVFPSLSRAEKEACLQRFASVRCYPARVLFSGVKGMALVALLRDAQIRRTLIQGMSPSSGHALGR